MLPYVDIAVVDPAKITRHGHARRRDLAVHGRSHQLNLPTPRVVPKEVVAIAEDKQGYELHAGESLLVERP